jgi:hypothetical protein
MTPRRGSSPVQRTLRERGDSQQRGRLDDDPESGSQAGIVE